MMCPRHSASVLHIYKLGAAAKWVGSELYDTMNLFNLPEGWRFCSSRNSRSSIRSSSSSSQDPKLFKTSWKESKINGDQNTKHLRKYSHIDAMKQKRIWIRNEKFQLVCRNFLTFFKMISPTKNHKNYYKNLNFFNYLYANYFKGHV